MADNNVASSSGSQKDHRDHDHDDMVSTKVVILDSETANLRACACRLKCSPMPCIKFFLEK